MSDAFMPGLTVSELTWVKKIRRLPLKGEVPVRVGAEVGPETVVARTFLPGRPHLVAAASFLNIEPGELPAAMVKKAGEQVRAQEVLARYRALFGLIRSECRAPAAGVVERISPVTGQVVVREPAAPVAVKAYIAGTVSRVIAGEGVEIETAAALIEGIFGVGGENCGELRLAVSGPGEILEPRRIKASDGGCILIGGALVSAAALRRAEQLGVRGIICGGVLSADLRDYLGYDIGVAITGQEDIGLSLVVTEGFGRLPMAAKTFALLADLAGRQASINGSTQIRAGVMRPEIVVPRADRAIAADAAVRGLELGSRVRLIRSPWFGQLGSVVGLPSALAPIASEARVRVVEVELADGRRVTAPRANVEILG